MPPARPRAATTETIVAVAEALVTEMQRRASGAPPDDRFDVPLAMLADLADELGIEVAS